MDLLAFLLNDLKVHRGQSSWDWEADLRFAKALSDAEAVEILTKVCHGGAPWPVKAAWVAKTGITQKRLRCLRQLVRSGQVVASWTGTGGGGRSEFGVGRVRDYDLA